MMSRPNVSPINLLQELCVKHNAPFPKYEMDEVGMNESRMFVCIATAFNFTTRGEATAKQQAKHLAAVELLQNLRILGHVNIESIPEIPRPPESDLSSNPVSRLSELCAKQTLPMPVYQVIKQTGESHAPEFTMACKLSSHTTTGCANSKKTAKKVVAQQMLDIIEKQLAEADSPIPIIELEPVEEVIKRYRRIKQDRKKLPTERLSDRHLFFENLPKEHQEEAAKHLCSADLSDGISNKEIVHLTCQALKIPYKVSRIRENLLAFELECDYDCVICGKLPNLWNDVIKYFKVMLNLTEY